MGRAFVWTILLRIALGRRRGLAFSRLGFRLRMARGRHDSRQNDEGRQEYAIQRFHAICPFVVSPEC